MASCDIKLPEDFLRKLKNLGDREEEIAKAALEAGGKVVLEKMRSNLVTQVGKDTKYPSRSTGQLIRALGMTEVRVDRNGNYNIKVGFDEDRPDGKSNAMLASILEYGKHGQPPRPFLKPAKSASKGAALEAMKSTLEQEMEKL